MSRPVRVGTIRPSQMMWSYGIGSLIDLPRLSVMIEGLHGWDTQEARLISENRLLSAVKRELGHQVESLYEPPIPEEDPYRADETDPVHQIGVPVRVFPRWLRCPRCGVMSRAGLGVFRFKGSNKRPDEARYIHENCPKRGNGPPPACIPARFLVACEAGHLDDFPWREFVHRGPTDCEETLEFFEVGSSLETANLFVGCKGGRGFPGSDEEQNGRTEDSVPGGCGVRPRSMVEAFGDSAEEALPSCRGRHPHLNGASGDCDRELQTILLGASNSWFPKSLSVLSIPRGDSELEQAIEEKWAQFREVESEDDVAFMRRTNQLGSATRFSDEDILEAVERRRRGDGDETDAENLKVAEWEILSDPGESPDLQDFRISEGDVPEGFDGAFLPTIRAEKLREVNALIGFTRLEAPEDLLGQDDELTYAPLSRSAPQWVPANEVRGEGILIRFDPEAMANWEGQTAVRECLESLREANRRWRAARRLPPDEGYPGDRHVLVHTFSHLLMRELALECGYSGASIRERVYSGPSRDGQMAGVLIYTAAPDSEGTLGGLVRLGESSTLGRLIDQALDHARLCTSDPLCAEHDPVPDRSLHGAACHACTFAPETSCEFGNRFLDRATAVETLVSSEAAFFD